MVHYNSKIDHLCKKKIYICNYKNKMDFIAIFSKIIKYLMCPILLKTRLICEKNFILLECVFGKLLHGEVVFTYFVVYERGE